MYSHVGKFECSGPIQIAYLKPDWTQGFLGPARYPQMRMRSKYNRLPYTGTALRFTLPITLRSRTFLY